MFIPRLNHHFLFMAIGTASFAFMTHALGAPLTVRVDAASGAPRILVNGKAVRARMFWGAPGSSPVHVTPTGREISFDFTAEQSALNTGTMHFRFGQIPGDVFLDNIRVTEMGSAPLLSAPQARGAAPTPEHLVSPSFQPSPSLPKGGTEPSNVLFQSDFESGPDSFGRDWTFWPPGEQNTVATVAVEPGVGAGGTAGLHITLKAPPGGKWPDWHVYHIPNLTIERGRRYHVTLWARAEPARDVSIAFYKPGRTFLRLGGPPGSFESQIRLAAGAGVHFVSFPVDMPWPPPGEQPDWTSPDAACEQVLAANPNALLIPRIGVDPPDWWCRAHPDDTMEWEDGSRQNYGVPASPVYRRDAAEHLASLVEHLEMKFGQHVAGYHPNGQNTGEFFYQDTWGSKLNGYAPADAAGFQSWLKDHYTSDQALRDAWRDPSVSLDTAPVPTPAQRRGSPSGILRDPLAERPLIAFADYQQSAMAGLVCDLAHAVRQASHGQKLVLFFYGYLFEFAPVRLGPTTAGHYNLRRVLDCSDIDMLCSPISYFDRGIGESAPAMTAAESVALAHKMWLFEDDTATYLSTGDAPGSVQRVKTLDQTNALLTRNVAEEATRNFATWWMDLGATGWFNDPGMWAQMRALAAVDRPFLDHPTPFHPQVAAVIDERSMLLTSASAWEVTSPGVAEVRAPLGRMGSPYGQYLLDDVEQGRVHASLVVFLNAWRLSAEQRKGILANTAGAARVWCYAPGCFDGSQTSSDAMIDLTGFRLSRVSPAKAWANPTAAGELLGLHRAFGINAPVTPLFAASDATAAETLAVYPDGSAAVALRKTPSGWSLFVGAPGLTSELLRIAARKAGVHLFTETDCNIYANGPIIALHASEDGTVKLDTGRKAPVHDALTGEPIGKGPQIMLSMKKGETRVLTLDGIIRSTAPAGN